MFIWLAIALVLVAVTGSGVPVVIFVTMFACWKLYRFFVWATSEPAWKSMGFMESPKVTEDDSQFIKIKAFLEQPGFQGFTKKDLFIMNFVKGPWGQDIAALSNMAEALRNLKLHRGFDQKLISPLLAEVVHRACHEKVNPWKKQIDRVSDLGAFGYYLEHLNIILGCYQQIVDDNYRELNERITKHLVELSLSQENAHARLLPHVKMRWSADQAAILYSIHLFDTNNGTDYLAEPKERWLDYMRNSGTHHETGLFITEVMGTKKYSKQPRGCSLSYMLYYMLQFEPYLANQQWELYEKHMGVKRLGVDGYREYLPSFKGKWTPDSGPVILGVGVAATGLSLKFLAVSGEPWKFWSVLNFGRATYLILDFIRPIPLVGRLCLLGTDLLATSIMLSARSDNRRYI